MDGQRDIGMNTWIKDREYLVICDDPAYKWIIHQKKSPKQASKRIWMAHLFSSFIISNTSYYFCYSLAIVLLYCIQQKEIEYLTINEVFLHVPKCF